MKKKIIVILLLSLTTYFGFVHLVVPWLFVNTSGDIEISNKIHDKVIRQIELSNETVEGNLEVVNLKVFPIFYNKMIVNLLYSGNLDAKRRYLIESELKTYLKKIDSSKSLEIKISRFSFSDQ